jgi:hypothetical protein
MNEPELKAIIDGMAPVLTRLVEQAVRAEAAKLAEGAKAVGVRALAEDTLGRIKEYTARSIAPLTSRLDDVDARVKTTNDSTSAILDDLDARIAKLEAQQ